MHETNEPRRLNPWPFIISDLVLVGTALAIAWFATAPLSGAPLIAVLICVILGAIALAVPFVVNYVHRQELFLHERQSEVAALASSTAASAEQLSIATASLHQITEAAHKAVKMADHLPQRLQERVNEFKTQLNEVAITENEALSQEVNTLRGAETERLEAAIDRIQKVITEMGQREAAVRAVAAEAGRARDALGAATKEVEGSLAKLEERTRLILREVEKATARLVEAHHRPLQVDPVQSVPDVPSTKAELPKTVPPMPARGELDGVSQAVPLVALEPVASSPVKETVAGGAADAPELLPAKDAGARRRREKPDTNPGLDLGLDLGDLEAPEDIAPAISADGQTRLIVTAYIGIGNKLYARGDGPGLSWEKGVPLQFVSIGKWRWETAEADAPLTIKLLRNDQDGAVNLGTVTLIPGHQHEVMAKF